MAALSDLPFARDVVEDYSGRGMYGRATVGVVVDRADEARAIAWIEHHYGRAVAWDTMGRDSLIVYDPRSHEPLGDA